MIALWLSMSYLLVGVASSIGFYNYRHRRIYAGKMYHHFNICNCKRQRLTLRGGLAEDYASSGEVVGYISEPQVKDTQGVVVGLDVRKLKWQWSNHYIATMWKTVLIGVFWPSYIPVSFLVFMVAPRVAKGVEGGVKVLWDGPVKQRQAQYKGVDYITMEGEPLSSEQLAQLDQKKL